MPRVSVITPCFNAGDYLSECIDSVIAQTFADWELVVVDDGSTDDSAERASAAAGSNARVRLIRQENSGVSAARNAGYAAAAADSDYLLFLDADDTLDPRMLERTVAYLDGRPEVGLVHCRPEMVDERGRRMPDQWWPPRIVPAAGRWGIRELRDDEPETPWISVYALAGIVPSLALVRRDAYAQTPGWDENFGQPCEDTDLFLQVALRSAVHYLPETLVRRRIHATQSVAEVERLDAQRERLYAKWRRLAAMSDGPRREVEAGERLLLHMNLSYRMSEAASLLRGGRLVRAARYAGGAARRYALPLLLGRRPVSAAAR